MNSKEYNNSYEVTDLKSITPEQTKALQSKALEILLYFKDFCEEHGLLFYLCGGCCIGAIRHNGFIPWDDDVDVFMPRDDYEKLAVLWPKYADTDRYTYCRTNKTENYHDAGASIRDNNTTFINKHSVDEDICHGLGLEIMPIDGYPNSKFKRFKQLIFAMIFALFNVQRLPDNKGKFLRVLARVIYAIIPSKKLRYKIWKYSEKQMSKYKWDECGYVTELIGSVKGMLLKHPKEWFETAVYKDFNGYKMPVMAGYDQYLRRIFGDYMQLPPEEKRIPKHNTVYINLNESYKKYKGVYYCVKNQ